MKQGDIYLVNFGKKYNSEIGKVRPAVVVQNNYLNRILEKKIYKQVLVVPLSTIKIEDDFRMKIEPRDKLEKDSYIIANWICMVDVDNILLDKGLIAKLNEEEIKELREKICNLI